VRNAAIRDPDLGPVHDPVLAILTQLCPCLQKLQQQSLPVFRFNNQ
jgi:hypothetical protein